MTYETASETTWPVSLEYLEFFGFEPTRRKAQVMTREKWRIGERRTPDGYQYFTIRIVD